MTTFAASVTIVDLPVGTTVTGVELLKSVQDFVCLRGYLSTKLRLAPSTRNTRDKTTTQARRASSGPKPWEADFADTVN